MAFGATAAAAAAARRKKEQRDREEEEMTQYSPDELKEEWEFKIVRSETAAFRKPETLKQLIEEEAQAGWVFLEKLDDSRIRFKRSPSSRYRDALLPPGVDAYRTRYGRPSARAGALTAIAIALLLLGMLGFLVTARGVERIQWSIIALMIGVVLMVVGMLVVKVLRRR